jgi:hypothetical protein
MHKRTRRFMLSNAFSNCWGVMLAQTSLIASLVHQPLRDERYKSKPTLIDNLFEVTVFYLHQVKNVLQNISFIEKKMYLFRLNILYFKNNYLQLLFFIAPKFAEQLNGEMSTKVKK